MPKAKIVIFDTTDIGDYDTVTKLVDQTMEWEEVSKEDLDYLRKNMHRISDKIAKYPSSAHLVVLDDISIEDRIKSIKDIIEKDKIREEERIKKIKMDEEKKKGARMKDLKTIIDSSLKDLFDETNTTIENKREEYNRVTSEFKELNRNLSLILEELNSRKVANKDYGISWLLSVHDEYGRESKARSMACEKFLESFGFYTMGYYIDTDQVAIHIRIKENNKSDINKTLNGIKELLPYLKKHDERGMQEYRFGITTDYTPSYHLGIVSPNKVFIRGIYGTLVESFCTIKDALVYISKNLYYRV
jgi:hypothetical protein